MSDLDSTVKHSKILCMNPTLLTDTELHEAYVSECAMSMRMAADKLDNSANEARIDLIADEMMARGIL